MVLKIFLLLLALPLISAILVVLFIVLIVRGIHPKIADRPPQKFRVNVENLTRDILTLSQVHHSRSTFDHSHLQGIAAHIKKELTALHGTPQTHAFAVPATSETYYENIWINVDAVSGHTTSPPLLIAAHYDAHGETPGADDNATGVAGLLEIARILKSFPPSIPCQLAFFANEESPFFGTEGMGAVQHAKMLRQQGQNISLMISLEMLGFYSEEKGSQRYPLAIFKPFYPDRGNFIAFVSTFANRQSVMQTRRAFERVSEFPVASFVGPSSIHGLLNSDHYAFIINGYPAMMITDTAYYRNPHYHLATDTLETLDMKRFSQVVAGIANMLIHWNI